MITPYGTPQVQKQPTQQSSPYGQQAYSQLYNNAAQGFHNMGMGGGRQFKQQFGTGFNQNMPIWGGQAQGLLDYAQQMNPHRMTSMMSNNPRNAQMQGLMNYAANPFGIF